jgi:DNA-binding MarR family transcriptional regulator
MGVHPATLTGMLDRLEAAEWIVRERDPADRRAVLVRVLPKRAGELMGHYAGMNGAIDRICASYDGRDLTVIAEFLERVTAAGREANTARVED